MRVRLNLTNGERCTVEANPVIIDALTKGEVKAGTFVSLPEDTHPGFRVNVDHIVYLEILGD